ncbi:unnamed protein product [Ceutorhynchus assimilis]|uniref:DUF7041 domain-containing protein n=1 Tax=Ceutorhynchus assimilis TaxID=467358 RepID=A0A9N9MSH1_9CUCU|nr:unnamed protein product [Ceutorhynchus assimilis]
MPRVRGRRDTVEDREVPIPFASPVRIPAINIKLPQFWSHDSVLWFVQVEAVFSNYGITDSKIKYNHIITALPPETASYLRDILVDNTFSNFHGTKMSCSKCDKEMSAEDASYKIICDICSKPYCLRCSKITKSEAYVTRLQERTMIFCCRACNSDDLTNCIKTQKLVRGEIERFNKLYTSTHSEIIKAVSQDLSKNLLEVVNQAIATPIQETMDKKMQDFARMKKRNQDKFPALDQTFLKEMFLHHLPSNIKIGLLALKDSSDIRELAKMADNIFESFDQQSSISANGINKSSGLNEKFDKLSNEVAELKKLVESSTRQPKRSVNSTSPTENCICWYHSNYGKKAKKQSWPSVTFNKTPVPRPTRNISQHLHELFREDVPFTNGPVR